MGLGPYLGRELCIYQLRMELNKKSCAVKNISKNAVHKPNCSEENLIAQIGTQIKGIRFYLATVRDQLDLLVIIIHVMIHYKSYR